MYSFYQDIEDLSLTLKMDIGLLILLSIVKTNFFSIIKFKRSSYQDIEDLSLWHFSWTNAPAWILIYFTWREMMMRVTPLVK